MVLRRCPPHNGSRTIRRHGCARKSADLIIAIRIHGESHEAPNGLLAPDNVAIFVWNTIICRIPESKTASGQRLQVNVELSRHLPRSELHSLRVCNRCTLDSFCSSLTRLGPDNGVNHAALWRKAMLWTLKQREVSHFSDPHNTTARAPHGRTLEVLYFAAQPNACETPGSYHTAMCGFGQHNEMRCFIIHPPSHSAQPQIITLCKGKGRPLAVVNFTINTWHPRALLCFPHSNPDRRSYGKTPPGGRTLASDDLGSSNNFIV